jgi:cytochrome c oxidase assembly protein subunit 15
VAVDDFTSGDVYDPANWSAYTKHDYAIFNPFHTWVEFINRLIGAFTGIPVLLLALFSLKVVKRNTLVTLASWFGLVLLAFEAWLGKLVVDGNLVPNQITYHMFGALGLVAVFIFIAVRLKPQGFGFNPLRNNMTIWIGSIGLALLLIQIYLGTSVREEVDAIGKANLITGPDWIEKLSIIFKIHRTYSLIVIGVLGWFAIRLSQSNAFSTSPGILIVLLVAEVIVGASMAYFEMPAFLQPIHLMFAVFDFALVLFLLLEYIKKTKAIPSLS